MRMALVHSKPTEMPALRRSLQTLPGCSVVWMTDRPSDALARCRSERPDLLLLDVDVGEPGAAEVTRQLMQGSPCPVLVLSRAPEQQAARIFEAMGQGAIDAVALPAGGGDTPLDKDSALHRKIRSLWPLLAGTGATDHETGMRKNSPRPDIPLVVMGVSTGGPATLVRLFRAIPVAPRPAFVVVQHVDARFSDGLAGWLAGQLGWPVGLAEEGGRPEPGTIHLAHSTGHLVCDRAGRYHYVQEPATSPYKPSVDVFFESLASAHLTPGCALLLSGMGDDGARGLLALRRAGWTTVAQDKASSVIYGMPRAAVERGAAMHVWSLDDIATHIEQAFANKRTAKGNERSV